MKRFQLTAWSILAGMIFTLGCQDPAVQTRWERRGENLNKTLSTWNKIEEQRIENLGRGFDWAERRHQLDIDNTRDNAVKIDRRVEWEFDRWEEMQPVYQRRVAKGLRGDPESIQRTYPYIAN